jgi:glycosyltransferase involved in cell wall biosynthesis
VKAGFAEQVHFLGTRADIPRILSALNVFVLTSKNEANPVSILEALSVQVPVVATKVGCVPSSVKSGVTGFLVESGDAPGMAQQVVELIHNAGLAKSLGQAGRREVVTHWSLDRMVRGYEQLIIEVYQRKQSGPTPEPKATESVEFCGAS